MPKKIVTEDVDAPKLPLRLEWRTPQELNENPKNWRSHPQSQTDALQAAIGEVGWAGAALYNERTARLIDGHARRKLPEGLLVDGRIPVLIGNWSEEQEQKILLTLDPLASMATANLDMLKELAGTVTFDDPHLGDMLSNLLKENHIFPEPEPGNTDPDEVPATPQVVVVEHGDVWSIGGHRVVCGDSLDPSVLELLLGQENPDMLFCDPPYNVEYEGNMKQGNKLLPKDNKLWKGGIKNDAKKSDFPEWLAEAFATVDAVLKVRGIVNRV